MDTAALYRVLDETTTVYRKGEEIVHRDLPGGIRVTEVYGYPPAPPEGEAEADGGEEIVDLHFFKVGVDRGAAREREADLRSLLSAYPDPARLAGGPSYIETGAVFGSQEVAMRLYAVGEVLGFWRVITPARLGITGSDADTLAGQGMVMMSGYKGPEGTGG